MTDADREYRMLFKALEARLRDDDGRELLFDFDDAVGERLGEHEETGYRRAVAVLVLSQGPLAGAIVESR